MFDQLRRSMMSRMVAVGVVALATSGAQVSCSSGDTSQIEDPQDSPPANASFTTLLVLRDAAGTEKYTFQRGELITFEVTVRNRTSQAAEHQFTGYTGTVDVFNNGGHTSLWNPFHDRVFAQVVQTTPFPAADSQVHRFTWNQVLPDGTNLAVGTYEARGALNGQVFLGTARTPVDGRELTSTLRQFTIQ